MDYSKFKRKELLNIIHEVAKELGSRSKGKNERVDENEKLTLEMRKGGMSIRQIMKALDYKSPSAIQYFLKRNKA